MEFKIKYKEFALFLLICLSVILLFSFVVFRMAGLRVALGIVFVSLPFYLILNNFEMDDGEKFVFSLVFGLTIFPSLAYALGLLISFRISIFVVFALLILASVIIWKLRKK